MPELAATDPEPTNRDILEAVRESRRTLLVLFRDLVDAYGLIARLQADPWGVDVLTGWCDVEPQLDRELRLAFRVDPTRMLSRRLGQLLPHLVDEPFGRYVLRAVGKKGNLAQYWVEVL